MTTGTTKHRTLSTTSPVTPVLFLLWVLALSAVVGAGTAAAQGTVRAWGMGGAGCAAARGLAAVQYNPANLAFSDGMTVGLASAALDVHNNAISLERYNEITGSHLDADAKESLLADIPADGLRLDADARASALGLQTGSMAFSFAAVGAGRGNLDKDYFDLVLYGNALGETVDFSNTWGEGYALGSAALSYGTIVMEVGASRLSAGANVRFLQGIYEMHVEEAYGHLTTDLSEISGEAFVSTCSAQGGQGYGVDVGFALQTPGGLTIGLAVDNVQSRINWSRDVEHNEFSLTADDVNLLNSDLDAAVSDADTSYAADPYTTSLPRRARLGAAKQVGSFLVAADYIQGFENRSGTSRSPRFQAGVEWHLAGFCRPRVGLSQGGGENTSGAAGLGFKFGPWLLDLAAVSSGGLQPGANKGVGLAMGSSLAF